MPASLRALRHRDFALLWTGQTVSSIGDWVYLIVIAWWVLEETGSAAIMGTVLIVTFLPVALASLVGGVVVDRLRRVPILVVSDVLRGVAVLAMAGLAAGDEIHLWMVYALGLLFGISDAFFQPAYFALVPELVPEDDLPSANALTSMGFQLGRVVGPAIGGVIVAAGGAPLGFVINGFSFLVPAVLILPVLGRERRPEAPEARLEVHWLTDFREGIAAVRAHPILWVTLLVGPLVAALLVGPFQVAMPFLVAERFGRDSRVFGFLLAVFPVGFILGSLWGGRLARLRRRGLVMYGGMAAAGVMLALYGLPVPLVVLAAAALVNGFSLELHGLAYTNALQELVPGEKLGRVASLNQLTSWVATPVAFAVFGWATDVMGPAAVFLMGAGAAAGLALLPLGNRRIWGFD